MIFDESITIEIADISHHQGFPPKFPIVDFNKMKLWGMRGCVMRASHGDDSDNSFIYNWATCRNILPRSSYHFYENQIRPIAQAEKYWSMIEGDIEGMLFLDLEDRTDGRYYHWDYWYQFLEHLKRLSGLTKDDIGIYAGHYYIRESFTRLPSASVAERLYFKQYKLWYPWYFEDRQGNPTPFNPIYRNLPYTFPWDDSDLLAVQTGTPVIGFACGANSHELDYNRVNGIKSFEKIFKQRYMLSNSISINIRRV